MFFKRKLTTKEKFIAHTSTFVILGIVIIAFVVLPSIKEINRLNKQISLYKTELEQKYQERFNVRKTIDDLERARKLLPSLWVAFIPKEGEIDFVENLEQLADKYSLNQQLGLSAEAKNKNTGLAPIAVTLTLEGDFPNIVRYLEELEKQNIYINFKDVLFSQRREITTAHFKGVVWKIE